MTAHRSTPSPLKLDHGQRLEDYVRSALTATGYRAIAVLNCDVVDGAIVLSGVVSSFYLKQVAQQAVLKLRQSQVVRNVIEVRPRISRD